jgi:DNA-binding MarR family transcriptional regulator
MPKTQTAPDTALLGSELRVVLGQLVRRLRAENRFPLGHAAVLGRLDREGESTVSELASAERVRPQSMAQTVGELEADELVRRRPDLDDRRRALVELTPAGLAAIQAERRNRAGWLAEAIALLSAEEQALLGQAVDLLRRLAYS